MRGTRAYIASAGTAVVLLGAAVAMLVIVSSFVAFGSWPGTSASTEVDQLVLRDVQNPDRKTVRVRADAVSRAQRVAERQRAAVSAPAPQASVPTTVAPSVTPQPSTQTPSARTPAPAPAAPQAPTPVTELPQRVDEVTRQVGGEVEGQVQNLQTQVGEVVGELLGGTTRTLTGVTDAAGSLLGGNNP